MSEETKQLVPQRTLGIIVLQTATILSFATATILALALLAYLLDLWGSDVLRVEVTMPEGLLSLPLIPAFIGVVLWNSHSLAQENARLEQKMQRLALDKVSFEERISELEQELLSKPTGNYDLRIEGSKVFLGREEIPLASLEFRLLECLMSKDSEICEYEYIFEQVWPEESKSSISSSLSDRDRLTALVLRLRKKLTPTFHDYVKNHPGRGYEFVQWER